MKAGTTGYIFTRFTREETVEIRDRVAGGESARSVAKDFGVQHGRVFGLLKQVEDRLDPKDDHVAVYRAINAYPDSYNSLTHFERQTVHEELRRRLDPMFEWVRQERISELAESWGCTVNAVYRRLGYWERSKAA